MNTDNNNTTKLSNSVINERLAYVDFKLRFTGHISRADLGETFGIAEAAASRVLKEYGEIRPDNKTQKANTIIRENFSPLISIDGDTALGMLANGFNKNKLTNNTIIPYVKIGAIPHQLNASDVAMITRAISGGYAITCKYLSENSDNHGERTILPLAIMYDGTQWMYRGCYRAKDSSTEFKNFRFTRTIDITEKHQDKEFKRLEHEELANDKAWNLRLPLALKLHSNLNEEKKSQIRKDFGIPEDSDELFVSERQALIWMIKRKWYIDDRSSEQKNQEEKLKRFFQFELTNVDMIKMLESQVR
ncbi:WYL domain-containing protein [Shewanella halotolerans]|uniref:WYL domain-containing protein n=1 Tax=Shewanella halotolerans TaxID=2864204 RepID=UPI001C656088|nr:WYL domain-containing protein [Shewanella halotolerans]QYJ89676.1 WYL domain-containing protein [Shewanella halotolerans]